MTALQSQNEKLPVYFGISQQLIMIILKCHQSAWFVIRLNNWSIYTKPWPQSWLYSVLLFFRKSCQTNAGVAELTAGLCVKNCWPLDPLDPPIIFFGCWRKWFLAMGRKKIQITRIVDERNRQVSIFFLCHIAFHVMLFCCTLVLWWFISVRRK